MTIFMVIVSVVVDLIMHGFVSTSRSTGLLKFHRLGELTPRFYFSGLFLPVVLSAENRSLFKIIVIISLVIRKIRSRAKIAMEAPYSPFRRQTVEKSILKCFHWLNLHLLHWKIPRAAFHAWIPFELIFNLAPWWICM